MKFGSRPHKAGSSCIWRPVRQRTATPRCGVLGSDHPLIERTDHGELAMNRSMNNTTNRTTKTSFASRPIRIALAMKIAFAILAANVSFAAAKALLVKAPDSQPARVAADASSVQPFILPIDWQESTAVAQSDPTQNCHGVTVETDEGYGVRGQTIRFVCRKAL